MCLPTSKFLSCDETRLFSWMPSLFNPVCLALLEWKDLKSTKMVWVCYLLIQPVGYKRDEAVHRLAKSSGSSRFTSGNIRTGSTQLTAAASKLYLCWSSSHKGPEPSGLVPSLKESPQESWTRRISIGDIPSISSFWLKDDTVGTGSSGVSVEFVFLQK